MKILVIAAHPDDEILGCGGTIARHTAEGDEVHIMIVAEGATSRDAEGAEDVGLLKDCARAAAKVLGAKPPMLSGFPDNRLDTMDRLDVIQEIERYVDEIGPNTVFTHHGGDLNIDHRIIHEAVITACRPLPGSPVQRIFTFETISSTEWASAAIGQPFRPVRHVDISAHLPTKLAALECYGQEMRKFPHARSREAVEAQARLRGSQVGMMAAEAFQTELDLS
jgi:LmbE family N-acetylglucosaminyl deacetylase